MGVPSEATTVSAGPGAPEAPPLAQRLRRAAVLLAVASAIALALAVSVVALVLRADFLTGAAEAVTRFIFDHGAVASLLASSPLLAVLLVGYGYMQRAIRRRAAAAAAAGAAPGSQR